MVTLSYFHHVLSDFIHFFCKDSVAAVDLHTTAEKRAMATRKTDLTALSSRLGHFVAALTEHHRSALEKIAMARKLLRKHDYDDFDDYVSDCVMVCFFFNN